MEKSHVAGWASDAPTPAQIKELFAQIDSGRVTKTRLQAFLRNEQPPVEIKAANAFSAFLDKELPALGLVHWRSGDEYSYCHYIGTQGEKRLGIFPAKKSACAEIVAMPYPEKESEVKTADTFQIRVFDREALPKFQKLAEKFVNAGFGAPIEIID